MTPLFGLLLHAIGGLAGGSVYVPFCKIHNWSWQTYWLIMCVVAYLIMPSVVAWIRTPQFLLVLWKTPGLVLFLVFFFGILWGVGGLTFGLSIRYLGMSLGIAMSLGLCTTFGSLLPPIVDGTFSQFVGSLAGRIVLVGIVFCLAGIALCGYAGICKERELSDEQKRAGVREFSLVKGFAVAIIAGVASSFLAFGINVGKPIGQIAIDCGIPEIYQNTPLLVLVMGGFAVTNVVWCLWLSITGSSLGDYAAGPVRRLAGNYGFAILAGVIGYNELFWYGMGTTKMGQYDFSSWPIHMALVIVFSSLWGILLREWHGVGRFTRQFLCSGLATLVLSTVVIGAGNCVSSFYPPDSIVYSMPAPREHVSLEEDSNTFNLSLRN